MIRECSRFIWIFFCCCCCWDYFYCIRFVMNTEPTEKVNSLKFLWCGSRKDTAALKTHSELLCTHANRLMWRAAVRVHGSHVCMRCSVCEFRPMYSVSRRHKRGESETNSPTHTHTHTRARSHGNWIGIIYVWCCSVRKYQKWAHTHLSHSLTCLRSICFTFLLIFSSLILFNDFFSADLLILETVTKFDTFTWRPLFSHKHLYLVHNDWTDFGIFFDFK